MPKKSADPFELLRDKKILAILDGDTDLGEIDPDDGGAKIKLSIPYLSGLEK